MNTPTNAYLTKLSSGTILAILLLSGLAVAIPLASTVRAANASPGIITTNDTVLQGAPTISTVSWKVSNPVTNNYDIVEFEVATGPLGGPFAGTFGSAVCTDANGVFTAYYPTTGVVDFKDTHPHGGAVPLAPNSYDIFTCTGFATAAQSGANTADQYTQTYLTGDASSSPPSLVSAGTATIYVTAQDASISPILYKTSPVPPPSPQVLTTLVAGTSVYIGWQVVSFATPHKGVAGIPIVFSYTAASHKYNDSGLVTLTASGTTSTSGKANSTFFPDPVIADDPVPKGAYVIATMGSSVDNPLSGTTTEIAVTIPAAASTISVAINDLVCVAPHCLNPDVLNGIPGSGIEAVVTDVYTNPTTIGATPLGVTLAAVNTNGTEAGWGCSTTGDYPTFGAPVGLVTSISVTIPAFGSGQFADTAHCAVGIMYYFFGPNFMDMSYITGTATGFATASSKTITTWGINFLNSVADLSYLHPATPKSVPAGSYITITAKLALDQGNVPVFFAIQKAASSSKYSGTFSNGFANMTASTDEKGVASVNLTVSTFAGSLTMPAAYAVVGIEYPCGYPSLKCNANGGTTAQTGYGTGVITTEPGTAVQLVFKVSYDNTCNTGIDQWGCNFKSTVLPPVGSGDAVNGTTIYFDILAEDHYNNPTFISSLSNTEVTVSPTTGLSASNLYIAAGLVSVAGNNFGPVSWAMSDAVNTPMTLTATATLPGGSVSNSTTVTTVSALPTLSISPGDYVVYNSVIYSKYSSITFNGMANASLGYASTGPDKVSIVTVGYSLNGGVWHTHAISVPAWSVTWSFAVALPTGLNTVQFNATDSKGNVASTPIYQVIVDPAAPKTGFTTTTGSTVANGTPVTAWAYDLYGDFNTSSVVVKANGVALPAADIAVTGTNTLGKNSSFAISITGLTAGTWTLSMTASTYAGVTAAAVSIKVTVTVAPGSTFTSSLGAAQCTSGGFTGDCITFVNNAASAETVNVYFVWYNAAGQIVNIGAQLNVSFAAGASASFFSAYGSAGSYSVQAFVRDTSNNALSQQYSATVTVP